MVTAVDRSVLLWDGYAMGPTLAIRQLPDLPDGCDLVFAWGFTGMSAGSSWSNSNLTWREDDEAEGKFR